MQSTKSQVREMLFGCYKCRDDDVHLTTHLWERFYPKSIKMDALGRKYVYLNEIEYLPREDHIKRIRAKFQNDEHKFLPRSEQVRKARGISEEQWRKFLGY